MASINSQSWKKSSSFNTLNDSVDSLLEAHSMADIVALVGNEIPIDTGASYQEAQSSSKLVTDSHLNPMFLDPVAFLKSYGNEVKIGDPADMKLRPVDVTYVRFRCTMHGSSIDPRVVKATDLSFYFCLRLPQHTYNDATGVTTLIANSSPTPTSSTTARSLTSCFATTSSGTPSSGTPTKGTSITSTNGTSPAMTRFLSAQKSNGGTKKGYYGDLTFLDNMTGFQLTFGISPFMLPSSPTKTSTDMSCQRIIRDYGELCKLEIFMHLCMLNYVGHTKVDVGLNTLDIYSQISDVKQVYNQNGRMYHNTPDELFDRFLTLAVSLPVKASGWSVQLGSSYLSSLSKDLSEHITSAESTFVMPYLTTLTTKSLQMDALRNTRNHASAGFKIINKRKNMIKDLFREMQASRQRGINLETIGIQNSDSGNIGSSYAYQQSPSIAEQTIRQNTPGYAPTHSNNQLKVETRTHPQSGLQHPFDKDNNFLSRFPVDFRGCFNCGKTNHFTTKFCPAANSGDFDKTTFFNEMWAHKPDTKRIKRATEGQHSTAQINGSMNQYNHNSNGGSCGSNSSNMGVNKFYSNFNMVGINSNSNMGGKNSNSNMGGNNFNSNIGGNNSNSNMGGNNFKSNMGGNNFHSNMGGNNLNNLNTNSNGHSHYGPTGSQGLLKRNVDNNPA